MMGGRMSAGWWRDYRARNRERVNATARAGKKRRRALMTPEERRKARGTKPRRPRDTALLPQLYEHLRRGRTISFWQDELAMDLAQEHVLAELEGRDPEKAVAEYRAREVGWTYATKPLIEPGAEWFGGTTSDD